MFTSNIVLDSLKRNVSVLEEPGENIQNLDGVPDEELTLPIFLPKPKGKIKGGVSKKKTGTWIARFLYCEKRYRIAGETKEIATKKMKIILTLVNAGTFDGNIHGVLKQQGYPEGAFLSEGGSSSLHDSPDEGYLPKPGRAVEGKMIQRDSGTWAARFNGHGKRYWVAGETEEIVAKKLEIVLKQFNAGTFDGDMHGLLKQHGYEEGAYLYPNGQNQPPRKVYEDRELHLASKRSFSGSVRQRPNGCWEARYLFAKQRHSLYAPTEQEVQAKLLAVLTSIADGSYIGRTRETLVGFTAYWLNKQKQTDLTPSTLEGYESTIRNHIIPFFQQKKLQNLTTADIQDFINNRRVEGRADGLPGGLSYKSVLNIRNMMFTALKEAVHPYRLIRTNPVAGVQIKRPPQKTIRVLNDTEFKNLINRCFALEDIYSYAIGVLLYTGMRKGEILGLQYGDIDFAQRVIYVRQQLTRCKHPRNHQINEYQRIDTWVEKETKTGLYLCPPKTPTSVRSIPISDKAMEFLLLLKEQREEMLEKKIEDTLDWESMFLLTRDGIRPIDTKTFGDHVSKITKSEGLMDVGIHTTRHTFTTHLMRKAPGEVAIISSILGHADLSTTFRYTHALEDSKRSVINLL